MTVPFNGRTLRLGSTGNDVYAVKRALKAARYGKNIQPNKVFGIFTDRNLRRYQLAKNLEVDGRAGRETIASLSRFFDDYGYELYTGRKPGTFKLQLPEVFVPTHQTGGLGNLFPAIDLFASPATQVLAPEAGQLVWPHMIDWDHTKRVGGMTCYYQGAESGDTYFLTHMGITTPAGGYGRGQVIGTVAAVPHNWWPSHIHEGKHRGRYNPSGE